MTIEVLPFKAGLGAEIKGIDASRPVTPAERDAVEAAWHRHLVLLIRGAPMDDDRLMDFTRNFGELDGAPVPEIGRFPGVRSEIAVISNIVENGKPIGTLGAGEAAWHTDSSCNNEPPAASFLHALEVPPSGGDTSFCNMYTAYESLPDDLRAAIAGRTALHDATYTSGGALRAGRQPVTDVREAPGAHHPLVRTHPATGRKALYLGRRLNAYIDGLSVADSEALLDRLFAHATQPSFTWSHQWRAGDLIIWDNRCAMHRREPFDPAARRLMHRTQLRGARPQ